jgi:hypothetical protein
VLNTRLIFEFRFDGRLLKLKLNELHTGSVYFQLFIFGLFSMKKRRKPKVKIVTLQLCEVRKSRYSLIEKLPTCAA